MTRKRAPQTIARQTDSMGRRTGKQARSEASPADNAARVGRVPAADVQQNRERDVQPEMPYTACI